MIKPVRMRSREDVVHLHRARSVRVNLLLLHRFDFDFSRILGQRIVEQRSRSVQRLLQKRHIVFLRDDDRAFRHHRRQPARVIGVRMRVHHVANRLVGE